MTAAAYTEADEIEELELLEGDAPALGLRDFIRKQSPHLLPGDHLAPIIAKLEEATRHPIRLCISIPPRHGKTVTISHALAWWMQWSPADTHAYASYSDRQAWSKSRQIRHLAMQAGVEIGDADSLAEWRTDQGGGLLAAGAGSGLTGQGVNGLLIVDDPFKNRREANSKLLRDNVGEWFNEVVMTRLEEVESSASVIVIHCVARGEPVLLADGTWKPIEEIRPGEFVMAHEAGGFVRREVLAQRSSGEDDIVEVRTDRKTLRVNRRHPFLAKDGKWIKAGDLQAGDDVVVSTAAIGDTPDPDGFAWFFGFMMGDGWVTRWKRRNHDRKRGKTYASESLCVCAALSKDEDLNARVISEMKRHLGRAPRVTKFGYARLDASAAGRRLIDLGLTGGAHGKRIPAWVFRLTPEAKIEYLRGHAAADGHRIARCKDSWRVSSVSRDLVDDVRKLAISAGVRAGRVSSFKQTVRAPHSREAKPYECFGVAINFARAPEQIEKVRAVEAVGRAEVFDLTVAGAENFIAGGFVVHNTRWHEDDLIGRLAKSGEFEVINLTALAEEDDLLGRAMGEALWPDKYNRDFLERRRKTMGAYGFDALYQGRPRPKGSRLFGAPHYYDPAQINWTGCRAGIGADPAASEEDSACYSAIVAGRFKGHLEEDRILYIRDVYHEQVSVPQFCDDLRGFQERNDGAMAAVEGPGPGRAVMDTIWRVDRDARIVSSPAKGDKFQRAQGVAAAWNDGRVLVPLGNPPWLEPFLAELETWTGVNDAYSDQVDALAHLWNNGPEISIFDAA